jgi:hypothetical protein
VPTRPSSAKTSSLNFFTCRDSEFSKLSQGYKLVLSGVIVSKDSGHPHTVRVTVCWDSYERQSYAYVDVWSPASLSWNRVHELQPPTFYPHLPSVYKRDADHRDAADIVAAQLLQHAKWVLS